eukprot:240771-Amphidinium_carterae.1
MQTPYTSISLNKLAALHIFKDPACPACVRESGLRVLHFKNHEPHFGTLYMDLKKMNKPHYFGEEFCRLESSPRGRLWSFDFMVCANLKHSPTACGRCRVSS